ncbi:hypothetical protein ElyMa_006451600 [Elysia marginata]|uniref:Uncharacterized protein n=1 Tax=Elysia marginata TaxID=1093978 RepID=A0AAV4HY61_9GAST|nr:hypothetical protein ElyMa_006451600 [Elysia marginata]
MGMQRSVSSAQINKLEEEDFMATCMKHANRLYERYTRAYDSLNKLMPQTGGQKALHKHIKQVVGRDTEEGTRKRG